MGLEPRPDLQAQYTISLSVMSPLIGSNESVAYVSLAPIGGYQKQELPMTLIYFVWTTVHAGANSRLATLVDPKAHSVLWVSRPAMLDQQSEAIEVRQAWGLDSGTKVATWINHVLIQLYLLFQILTLFDLCFYLGTLLSLLVRLRLFFIFFQTKFQSFSR